MPSQIPANPSNISHSNLTSRHLARRRYRQRRRQRLREQREEQVRRQQQRDRQHRRQLQENQIRNQQQQRPQRQRQRQRQQRQPRPTLATHHIVRTYSEIEWERQHYLSLGFPEELDDIDPAQLLELLELENMDPIERAAQQQLQQYEQSIQRQPLTSIALNIEHSAQYQTEEELLQVQQAKEDEVERHMEAQLLILEQDQLEQLYQIQAVEILETEDIH
ncbi:unnamed protein product [Rotaria magnacalcarata]|nr:unnamed protein product [Rotaria magnacalcarata]CAF4073339.1 unnamed protein product [Rotaria magnacalcarata]CAF4122229.1 unnamed protein product [Rotaria magnacalcarata]CAF4174201.1 unnamed protein product [Rotaria magnacalcarata]